jgi:hypothetical protein
VHSDVEQRAGLLLTQPDRRARILWPRHPEHICRALRRKLEEQKDCHHGGVYSAGRLEPSRNLVIGPDAIARLARFQAQSSGLVRRNDATVSGELEEVFKHRGRLAALVSLALRLDKVDHGATGE